MSRHNVYLKVSGNTVVWLEYCEKNKLYLGPLKCFVFSRTTKNKYLRPFYRGVLLLPFIAMLRERKLAFNQKV